MFAFYGCIVSCGAYALRDFLFHRVNPRKWRYCSISASKELLINEEIKEKEVRVIGDDGETLGMMSGNAALKIAYDRGLDLVLIAPQATPPVCRIMDYGKYRFDREKKEKEAKKKQQVVELKEVQLSCRIDVHDFETKARNAIRFLTAGNKVRVVVRFKGREMAHQELGREMLTRFEAAVSSVGTVEKKPVLDGRILSMIVVPQKNTPAKN
ncbi:MAG: translation initiation factor IF-3 [Clostridia bacterium]|nr:translation initiation factor IF-3 [Clostridia bacterium]MBR2464995.1 translation initiation factor IF-3 [Clostridia bacterium]